MVKPLALQTEYCVRPGRDGGVSLRGRFLFVGEGGRGWLGDVPEQSKPPLDGPLQPPPPQT